MSENNAAQPFATSGSGKSPEEIAFELVSKLKGQGVWGERNRPEILDMYAECLDAVKGLRAYPGQNRVFAPIQGMENMPVAVAPAPAAQAVATPAPVQAATLAVAPVVAETVAELKTDPVQEIPAAEEPVRAEPVQAEPTPRAAEPVAASVETPTEAEPPQKAPEVFDPTVVGLPPDPGTQPQVAAPIPTLSQPVNPERKLAPPPPDHQGQTPQVRVQQQSLQDAVDKVYNQG